MSARSLRILCQIDWPTGVVSRLWQGSGPVMDADGNIWLGSTITDGLEEIGAAINGEAEVIEFALAGVSRAAGDLAWLSYSNDEIVGADVQLMIQECDSLDQPVGSSEVRSTGTIDNVRFLDAVDQPQGAAPRQHSSVVVEVANLFTLRRRTRGAVLSDTDQRARSAVLNPGADPDRFCERVPILEDKTVVWPRWN